MTAGLSTSSRAAAALLCLAALAACRPDPAPRRYTLQGQILAVHPDRQSLTIKHQDIEGYMPGMTMTFVVSEAGAMQGREPGELVTGVLEVGDTSSRLTSIEVTGKAPIDALPAEIALAEGLLQVGDPLPRAHFVDAGGRARALDSFRGAPLAITFTYTRCPLPEFCPRVDRQFAAVQAAIKADPALDAHLLTVSFDPEYDTPAVMAAHAASLGADPRVWTFATGPARDVEMFAARFGVAVTRSGDTAADIMHNLRTIVVDGAGTIRALHSGSEWTPDAIVADLRAAR